MALAAGMVLAFSVPQWMFRGLGVYDVLVSLSVAAVIALIAGPALSRFYRSSTPEGPEELSP